MIVEFSQMPYNGRTFGTIKIEPEQGDTIKDFYDQINEILREWNSSDVYFRIDLKLTTKRPDIDPRGWGELDTVIDGHFQLDNFLKGLRMAIAFQPMRKRESSNGQTATKR